MHALHRGHPAQCMHYIEHIQRSAWITNRISSIVHELHRGHTTQYMHYTEDGQHVISTCHQTVSSLKEYFCYCSYLLRSNNHMCYNILDLDKQTHLNSTIGLIQENISLSARCKLVKLIKWIQLIYNFILQQFTFYLQHFESNWKLTSRSWGSIIRVSYSKVVFNSTP